MSTKRGAVDGSPSASTVSLAHQHSRRGSISSLASTSKETISHALDQINQQASRTGTLTTFNEYTSPPPSSSGGDGKGLAGELQGGLTGLYGRLRASVGNVRDIVTHNLESGGSDERSMKSPKLPPPSPSSVTHSKAYQSRSSSQILQSATTESMKSPNGDPSKSREVRLGDLTSTSATLQKGLSTTKKEGKDVLAKASHGQMTKPNQLSLGASMSQIKPALTPSLPLPLKSPLAPLAPPTTVVSPAVAEANVNDGRDHLQPSKAEEQLNETFNRQKAPSPSDQFTHLDAVARADKYSRMVAELTSEAAQKVQSESEGIGVDGQANADACQNRDVDYFTTAEQPMQLPRIVTHPGTPQTVHSRTPTISSLRKNDRNDHAATELCELDEREVAAPSTPRSQYSHEQKKKEATSSRATSEHSKLPSSKWQDFDSLSKSTVPQIRNKVLSKDFWMKDDNARDCFYCGDSFSTFRRKHHCRTCGQIFDAKCTSILPGAPLGHTGSIRVCKPCEGIINGYDDSSEFSDDSSIRPPSLRPRHGSTGASDALGSPGARTRPGSLHSMRQSPKHSELTAPTMSIPATRKPKSDSGRNPTVLEIEGERTLTRPSSSRSLKSRPFTPSHRRHNSRHLHQRSFKALPEDSAPFHRNIPEEKPQRLPAFHDDNIIDPDLAPYLSDEASSGDEQIGIVAAMHGEGTSRSLDEKTALAGYLNASKKGHSRAGGDRSSVTFASRVVDADTHSLSSSRAPTRSSRTPTRSSRRRNLSNVANVHMRPSPRAYRMSAAVPPSNANLHESFSSSALAQMMSTSSAPAAGPRMIRSSSMRGAAAPAVELNSASLQHVRKLLRQLLQDSHVSSVGSWEKALVPILLQATDDVNPDMQNGDDIDIRHYVKLKKIPRGTPDDTSYVSGLVFTKNLALKSMPRSIVQPRILILTFPIEYSRHQQHFMSLEPVIRQEREYLENLVHRIAALQPNLLLVERNVSGMALEFLEKANIATAYNVKASVLEAVSRCSQTRILSSIDKLAIKPPQAGTCESFYLKTYQHGGQRKTYTFLSGCAKELGCTIVLRGADNATMAKVKRITEFMVYVVYNLKLETCLMRDEFALIPSATQTGTLTPGQRSAPEAAKAARADPAPPSDTVAEASNDVRNPHLAIKETSADVANADVMKTTDLAFSEFKDGTAMHPEEATVPEDVPMPSFYSDMVEEHRTKILSASPFVKFMQPYLLMRSREQERRLAYLRRLRDLDVAESGKLRDEAEPEVFQLINPEMVHERVRTASKSVREVLQAVHDTEYDKALHNYQVQSKQWETYISGNINLFDPEAHQNIAVLYSVVCTATTVPCSGPDLLALGFYNEHETDQDFEADCTLGQYVEDLCFGANTSCTANSCERKMFEHHRQYVHGEAQISVFVERYPCKLRGLQNTILMWSCCRVCGTETQVMPMSGSTWKYSFGKYLELSFWSKDIHARADICPHDLHREHLRYFGFKDLALRVQYDPITLLEVIVPRARITWKVDNDLRFKNDLYVKHETRINRFMLSVKARLKSILVDSVVPEKMEACKNEVNRLMERSREDHRTLVRNLQDRYMTSRHYETVPFNRAIRATQEKVAEWDNAFADFDRNYFPSEKDIRRLATLQLKKIFLDRDDTSASLTSNEEGTVPAAPDKLTVVTSSLEEQPSLVPQTRNMSPEKTQDMLSAVVDKDVASQNVAVPFASINEQRSAPPTAVPKNLADKTTSDPAATDHEDVRHLDLAMSSKLKEQSAAKAARPDGEPRAIDFATRTPRLEQVRAAQQAKEGGNIPTVEPEQEGGEPRKLPTILLQDPSQEPMKAKSNQPSGIPRPTEGSRRQKGINMSPAIHRTHSQPVQHQRDWSNSSRQSLSHPEEAKHEGSEGDDSSTTNEASAKPAEKKLSDRMGLSTLKLSGVAGHSMIPRSIVTRKDSHVSTLAKHFEQLSREFEKERLRERRQRFSKSRQARAYPMAAAKPIVEIYKNVREAVEERDPSDEDLLVAEPLAESGELPATVDQMAQMEGSRTSGEGVPNEDTTADNTETEENTLHSHVGSDTDGEAHRNDVDHVKLEEVPGSPSEHHALSPTEAQMDLKLDLPKHEKTSLMKTLTNFWAERSASGWQALDYPLNAYDHIFADSDIIVREDEPSSLIAFALGSEDYKAKLQDITSRTAADDPDGGDQEEMQRTMTRTTGTHLKYQFQEGSAKMLCKVFYAEQFEAVRRKCGVSERITESLSRCMKWDSKGGKTKSVFLKTLDDRFVLKSLPPGETQTFLRFAPAYFQLMSECLFQGLPSVIAKMVGFYQIIIKNPLTGVDFNWYLIVMENLFYDRSPTRIFDLKGSMRNRRIQSTGEQNEVLLDENMVDFIYESPLFAREHSKKLLRASVWNDTLFLARQNVMDYSLMIAIDEERQELVVGIIDVIRTYTWDKKLEFWFKDKGSRSRPTVTSPRDYKNRFREAMGRYVLQAPNCWHQFHALQLETKVLKMERDGDGEAHQQV
ncbi:MAG: hypothetical protein LQ344_000245 [Seirophora lacunosa]|nr:MAG: hypothetical protein LQ344_000245 [Seirophora lacunosa]